MLKVMVVDDEFLVRLGIKSLIDWEQHQFHFIGDAQDGLEALNLLEKQQVDIILTDIVMPRMNGIELIERVKSEYPETHIVVLSSHNDYEYVRKAMKLGVDDYILKASLTPEELLQMLLEVSAKIADQRSASGFSHAAAASYGTLQQMPQYPFEDQPAILLLVRPDTRLSSDLTKDSLKLLNLIEIQLKRKEGGFLYSVKQDEIVILLPVVDDSERSKEEALAFGQEVAAAAKRYIDLPVVVGISGDFQGEEQLEPAYAQAEESLLQAMSDSKDKIYREDIQQLMSFIHEHYTEELSLKRAAEMIRMSENYVSYLFKKETGFGLSEYLNQVRIRKAEELLLETRLPIYFIAEQVGYENINYFGRIFKKLKGESPQQFRSKYQK
ncbi:response regulator [Paenibacillus sp. GD4]|uniref:response regulator n=1 Tax=Paenibacillus sp. GD4 TaxID=3068890 RepID=UPI002796B140|nr:response regulator [Paenibacillus sp. GD4]MDQ1914788.1 response regulator [Paenibacillus sp. GD4]